MVTADAAASAPFDERIEAGEDQDQETQPPVGYETVAEFLEEARRRFQEGVDSDRENREEGLQDLNFLAGKQWEDWALQARTGRPCLTINQLPQYVAQVVGDIRINRPAIKVRPAQDADQDLADVREGLIRAIERNCSAQQVYTDAGQSQVGCGIGNFRVALKYAGELTFNRDLALDFISNPFAVIWDPMSVEPTGRDARYCFVVDEVPRKEFEAAHPDEKPSELSAIHKREGWVTRDTVRVTEYWRVIEKPVTIALLKGGQVVEIKDVPPGEQPVQVRQSARRYASMYLITGQSILEGPYEWPIDRVPILRVEGWKINVGDKRVRFGVVRWARDPQRLKNYSRSVAAETIARSPKGKWLATTASITEDQEDAFRASATSDDPLLLWSGQGNAPIYTPPPAMPSALFQEAQLYSQDMKDVTGLHDASLGIKSNETSGRAIMARQREGDVANFVYIDNLRSAISEGGRVINMMIPTVYDTLRIIRIVGEDDATKVQKINDPNDPNSVDINQGMFDVSVEAGPSYTTKRVEAADSMMQFVQAVPQAAQVAGDLIAKAQDWPMAEQIGERLKKLMPPQILAGEDGEEPPPPDPAQQAQQQLQMQGAQADVRLKIAQAVKAEADAETAGYLAQQAELTTASMQAHGVAGDPTFGKGGPLSPFQPLPPFNDPWGGQAPQGQGGAPQPTQDQAPPQMAPQAAPPAHQAFGQGMPIPGQPAPGEGFPAS